MKEVKQMPYTIYAENTPNPASMKFVSNKLLIEGEPKEYFDFDSAKGSPLATRLFQLPFVISSELSGPFGSVYGLFKKV